MTLRGVWVYDRDTVVAVSNNGTILHYQHGQWTIDDNNKSALFAVWGQGPDDIFAVGSECTIWHYDGSDWQRQNAPCDNSRLYSVWGDGQDHVFAVGVDGTILQYSRSTQQWEIRASGTEERLYSIWGSGPGDIFTVGNNGTIRHYDGSGSQVIETLPDECPTKERRNPIEGIASDVLPRHETLPPWIALNNTWDRGGDDIYVVGKYGTVLHYDGATWQTRPSPTQHHLYGVWATAVGGEPEHIFAVGAHGTIVRYEGDSLIHIESVSTEDLLAVSGTSTDNVFAVGQRGTVFHYDGTSWAPIALQKTDDIYALCLAAEDQIVLFDDAKQIIELTVPYNQWQDQESEINPAETCGNGIVEYNEQCDFAAPGSNCLNSCVQKGCGNGVMEDGEDCDDGNTAPGDGCSGACQKETYGDGVVNDGEQCDPEHIRGASSCPENCDAEQAGFGGCEPQYIQEQEQNQAGDTPNIGERNGEGNDFCPGGAGQRDCLDKIEELGIYEDDTTIFATIAPEGDEDIFAVKNSDANESKLVRFDLWNAGLGIGVLCNIDIDTVLFIRDDQGNAVAENDDRDHLTDCSGLVYEIPAGQTVYAHVIHYDDDKTIAAPGYWLVIDFLD